MSLLAHPLRFPAEGSCQFYGTDDSKNYRSGSPNVRKFETVLGLERKSMNKKILVVVIIVLSIGGYFMFVVKFKAPTSLPTENNSVTDTSPSSSINPNTSTTIQKPAARQVTITGIVMSKSSNTLIAPPYSFVLNDSKQSYTVVLDNATSKNTKVINFRGKQVGNNFIQEANTVIVTGLLSGTTIQAQIIQVQTIKDEGA